MQEEQPGQRAGVHSRKGDPAAGTLWGSAWKSELRKSCEVRAGRRGGVTPSSLSSLSLLLVGVESRSGLRETVGEAVPATRLETCPSGAQIGWWGRGVFLDPLRMM